MFKINIDYYIYNNYFLSKYVHLYEHNLQKKKKEIILLSLNFLSTFCKVYLEFKHLVPMTF